MTTHIAPIRLTSKKLFKEAVLKDASKVYLEDPGMVNPRSGSVAGLLQYLEVLYVTNHPKRSWYAKVVMKAGKITVS